LSMRARLSLYSKSFRCPKIERSTLCKRVELEVTMAQHEDGDLGADLERELKRGSGPKAARFALALLSGIPAIGGVFSGAAGAWSEHDQNRFNRILAAWLRLQEEDLRNIAKTIGEVAARVDSTDERVEERMSSPAYLALIKKAFREWSAGDSTGKRGLIRNLLSNAAAPEQICGDDVIALFIDWIDQFTEKHFEIIRIVYQHQGATRREIWNYIHGENVREDSAEADLFKLLMQDLSIGHVIRQHREVDYYGNFVKARPSRSRTSSSLMKSAFDDEKQYELTGLGSWFVHYTMNDIVPRLAAENPIQRAGGE
jgi:hypothetical protein